jgi:hypothetical protein
MRTRRLILAALAAALAMGFAVNAARANRLSVTNQAFRITWASIRLSAFELGQIIACPLTLEGSFHSRTIRKVARALIGAVTRGIVKGESCTGGRATVLQEALPWHLTYEDFSGALPNIEDVYVLLRRYAVRVEATIVVAVACLYKDRGRVEENQVMDWRVGAAGQVTRATIDPFIDRYAGLASGSFGCPARGQLESEGQVFLLGNTTRISVTLI